MPPFDGPLARDALFRGIREQANELEVIELNAHVNDASFAEAAAEKLMGLMHGGEVGRSGHSASERGRGVCIEISNVPAFVILFHRNLESAKE